VCGCEPQHKRILRNIELQFIKAYLQRPQWLTEELPTLFATYAQHFRDALPAGAVAAPLC
jgi:hypothetical protein